MKGNYDKIAPYYDRLSHLVFGNAIDNAQKYLVPFIDAGSNILIIGGGTGWILEEISKLHDGLLITYVESSKKMISIAEARNVGNNKVIFLRESIQDVVINQKFRIVITPFVLDNFSWKTAHHLFNKIDQLLLPGGLWLYADFQIKRISPVWQKLLLRLMYIFFRLVCRIEAQQLPDTNMLFQKYQYTRKTCKNFFSGFICSGVYQKRHESH